MAIDPSIALQVQQFQAPDMMNALAKAQSIKSQQMQNRMNEREMQAMDAEAQSNAQLNALFRESGGDFEKMRQNPNLDINTAMKLEDILANKAKTGADRQNAQLGLAIKQIEAGTMILGSAQDQASYDAGLQKLGQLGLDTSRFPQQYSPETVDKLIQQGMTAKERMQMQRDQQRNALEERRVSAMEQRLSQGGQSSGVDAQDKGWEVKETANGLVRVNKYTGDVAPVTMEGQTLKGKPSSAVATEDERKAAGWTQQARLASQQMQEAMASDPSASQVGVKEFATEVLLPKSLEPAAASTLPANRQKFKAAASSFAEAALRAATGAGINESEARQKIQELTPVFGEDPIVTQDKIKRQEMYLSALEQRAGRAAPPPMEAEQPQRPSLSGQDAQALQWAQQNPNDPRAQAIMRRLSGNGI